MKRVYSEALRQQVRDAYAAGEEYRSIAARLGVSEGWAYLVVRDAGLVRRPTPAWPSSLIHQAKALYLTGLPCREVAAELARRLAPAPAPTGQWVFQHMQRLGLLRTHSRAKEIEQARRHGRDYDAIRAEAVELVRERRWSARRAARHLGVTTGVVMRALPQELRQAAGPEAQRRRWWEAESPEVEARLDRRAEVVYRRRDLGQSYAEIHEATGISTHTIHRYLRSAGLVKPLRKRRRSGTKKVAA